MNGVPYIPMRSWVQVTINRAAIDQDYLYQYLGAQKVMSDKAGVEIPMEIIKAGFKAGGEFTASGSYRDVLQFEGDVPGHGHVECSADMMSWAELIEIGRSVHLADMKENNVETIFEDGWLG